MKRLIGKIVKWIIGHKLIAAIIGVAIIVAATSAVAFSVSANNTKTVKSSDNKKATSKLSDGPAIAEEEKVTDAPVDSPYLVKVNRALNCITVYSKDDKGEYTVPYIAFPCSTGRAGQETPLGEFKIGWKAEWCYMVDGTWGQYTSNFNNDILFHSVPYFGTVQKDKTNLEYEQYNLLGEFASLGCVRLCVADAKWIYENCPTGTTVIVYDDYSSPGPLGKPGTLKLPYYDEVLYSVLGDNLYRYCGWDPTDPDYGNLWRAFTLNSADVINVPVGSDISAVLNQISALSPDGVAIPSEYLTITDGAYDLNVLGGQYQVTVAYNSSMIPVFVSKQIVINVVEQQVQPTPQPQPSPTPAKPDNTGGNSSQPSSDTNGETAGNDTNNGGSNTDPNSGQTNNDPNTPQQP
ncbi:MAG: L,D-transpeptidase [Lachnospiraceae bacterium]|nr:L,D-transpeptidase [Lachnospiraceae bacterium]